MAEASVFVIPPALKTEKEPTTTDYQQLLRENVSPRRARAALTKHPGDVGAARRWLKRGGYESESSLDAGSQLHGRMRKASQFDPHLADNLTHTDAILNSDLFLNSSKDAEEDKFVKMNSSVAESKEVREMAEKAFQQFDGKLEKQSPSSWAGWQTRWFYLWENKLEYYKDGSPIHKGVINLLHIRSIILSENDPRRFDIEVNTDGKKRIYELRGQDAEIVKKWATVLEANKCRAIKLGVTPLPAPIEKTVDLTKLHFKANTGDVLLFASQNTGGYIVQSATGGQYDHIGILIRHAPNQVCVLEALGRHGVQLYKWEDFIKEKWYSQYKSMAIRKLHIPNRSLRKKVVINIVNFVKEVVNCEYSWTPIKMMRRQSTTEKDLKDRSYFCSELVAKAYKLGGILRENCPSHAYTPTMFDEKHDLHLLQGARMLPEQIIKYDLM